MGGQTAIAAVATFEDGVSNSGGRSGMLETDFPQERARSGEARGEWC